MAKSPAVTKDYTAKQIYFALRYYLPTSPTYDNAYRSAIASGYSENYSRNITIADVLWVKEILVDIIGKTTDKKNLVAKAKRVLNKSLDSADERLSQDTAKFIAKTDAEFSEKQDITSGGDKIQPLLVRFIGNEDKQIADHSEDS